MNFSKYILAGGLLLTGTAFAQVDRTAVPKPQEAKEIKLSKPDVFKLDNGLTVLVVENNKIPKVSFQLSIDRGAVLEGDKAGVSSITGDLLSSGTTSMSKDVMDEEIDFMGASFSTWSTGMYGSGLKKQMDKLASIMSDVLMNPAFPESELARLKDMTISGIASSKKDPGAIKSNVEGAVNFGLDHPYGEIESEESVTSITLDDVRKYYKETFQPQNAYLTIVGDVKTAEVKPIVEKYFSKWQKGNFVKPTFKDVKLPHGTQVYFSPQTGAVQSNISVTFPVNLKPGSKDVLAATVMNKILGGGGFGARLMQNLREDKAYTYGCYSSLSPDELVGSFKTSGSFRNEVTDSALTQIMSELHKIVESEVTDEELKLIKASMAGKFAIALENPRTIARFAINTLKYNLPDDYYATYLQRLDKITKLDVMGAAYKYIKPNNANIVVVGNESIVEKLNRFDHHGKVNKIDFYGKPISDMKPAPAGVTVKSILKKSIKSRLQTDDEKTILKKIKKIKSITEVSTGQVQGMNIEVRQYKTKKGMEAMQVIMNGNVLQKTWFDGKSGGSASMMGKQKLTDEEIAEKQKEVGFMRTWFYDETTGKKELLGIVELNGKQVYKIKEETPKGTAYAYYDVNTCLPLKNEMVTEVNGKPQEVTVEFSDYKEFEGMLFAGTILQDMGPMKIKLTKKSVEVNGKIDKSVFKP